MFAALIFGGGKFLCGGCDLLLEPVPNVSCTFTSISMSMVSSTTPYRLDVRDFGSRGLGLMVTWETLGDTRNFREAHKEI